MSAGDPDPLPLASEAELTFDSGFGRSAGKILLTLGGTVGLIALWQAAVLWLDVPPYILPPPWRVLMALWAGLDVPLTSKIGFYLPLASTILNAAIGFLIGVV